MVHDSDASHLKQAGNVYFNRPGLAAVKWDAASNSVRTDWQGWANPAEFVAVLEAGLQALEEHPHSRGLVDCRNQKVVQQSDQDWANKSWFPRALATGLRRLAVIVPRSDLALMNVKAVLDGVRDREMHVAYFATVEEADEWLTGSPSIPPSHDPLTKTRRTLPGNQVGGASQALGLNQRVPTNGGDEIYLQLPGVATVSWNQEYQCVLVEWLGWANSAEYVALLEAGLRALKLHQGHRWIADGRNKRSIGKGDQEWVDRVWFPLAFEAGLKRFAVVKAHSHVARLNSEEILSRIPFKDLESASFDSLEDARRWVSLG